MLPPEPSFYLIPGLGADGRIFERLRLVGRVRILEWLPPRSSEEPLSAYAERFAAPIPPDEACWVVGVSFGGVVALEIGCLRPKARIVLISSVATPQERAGWVQLGAWLRADTWLPINLLQDLPLVAGWFFGAQGPRAHAMFRELLQHLPPQYTRWALRQLFHWGGCPTRPVAHIIGDRDRVFPAARHTASHVIDGGTHFAIVTHAATISRILNELAQAEG